MPAPPCAALLPQGQLRDRLRTAWNRVCIGIAENMGTLPLIMPAGPARRSGAREFLLNIDPGYQRLRHAAKAGLAVVLAVSMFEFAGPGGAIIAAICSLILMQSAFGRSRREQWRSMVMTGAAQFAVLGIVILVSPVAAVAGVKAALA